MRDRDTRRPVDWLWRWTIALVIGLIVLHGILFALWGGGPVIEVLPWFAPLMDALAVLAGAAIAFLAFGRYMVTREPPPFWVGLAFSSFSILAVFYLLSWPGLVDDDSGIIAELPNTSAWLLGLKFTALGLLLIPATLVPWPREPHSRNLAWLLLIVAVPLMVAGLIGGLLVAFEGSLPLLLSDGAFTPSYLAWFGLLMALFVVGTVLSAHRYRQTGDTLLGYVTIAQLAMVFFFVSSIIGGERYDTWWYWRRGLLVGGFAVVLFGLLSDYVGLYRQERQKTRELEALQRVTDPALAREGLDQLLQILLGQIVDIMSANAGAIFLLDEAQQELVLRKGVGIPEEQAAGLRVKVGEDFAGRVAARDAAFWVRDASAEPPIWNTYIRARGVRGMIGAPMSVAGRLVGVVQVDFLEAREFTSRDERLLEVVAERAALAIRQMMLLEDAQMERNRLRVLIDTAPVGITFHRAPDGTLELFNKTAEVIVGRPMAPEIGIAGIVPYYEVFRPNGEPLPTEELPSSRALRGETCTGVELLIRQPSGREVYILVNSAPLRDADGQITGAVLAFQDITFIREQERLRDEFISAAAHELKTPVTTIKGYAQLMRQWAPEGHEPREGKAIKTINVQCDRISRRVQEMLEAVRSRVTPPELHRVRFDLGELASEVVQRVQTTTELHRLLLEREAPAPVDADRERVEDVLVSLLDNSMKYSPKGGEIRVRVWVQNGNALVSVKDQGVGIPKDRQPHIFEPFYEAVPPGAPGYKGVVALSLYLSKITVERHNGRIWFESEEGKGSTFYFSLPLASDGDDGKQE